MIATAATTATQMIDVVTTVTIFLASFSKFYFQVVFPVDICMVTHFFTLL